MSQLQRILVNFAGSTVAIQVDDPRAAALIDFLIPPAAVSENKNPHCSFQVQVSDDEPALYSFSQDGILQYETTSPGSLAEVFQSALCRQLATESRDGLLFHAAALSDQGRGILIAGGIGAGKSTLTAWLLSKGLGYLTDELVYIPCGSDTLKTFTRPLHLKHPSRPVLGSFFDMDTHQDAILSSSHSDLIPAALINPQGQADTAPLNLVLFPEYQAQGEANWLPLSAAQTGQSLMKTLVNARNLPQHGFNETARLARTTPGYRMTYANFSQIEENLAGILSFC